MQARLNKEQALKEIESMKEKIIGENILNVLSADSGVKNEIEKVEPPKYLTAAVMTGHVYFDEEKNNVVQKLIKPIQSGEQATDVLYFSNHLTFDLLVEENTNNEIAMVKNIITRLTCKSKQLIGKLEVQDMIIAKEIATFFYQF